MSVSIDPVIGISCAYIARSYALSIFEFSRESCFVNLARA